MKKMKARIKNINILEDEMVIIEVEVKFDKLSLLRTFEYNTKDKIDWQHFKDRVANSVKKTLETRDRVLEDIENYINKKFEIEI